MRTVLLALVMTLGTTLASGSAMASSIEHIRAGRTSNDSIISVRCESCPAPVEATLRPQAPALEPGTQAISLRETAGRKETVRTEAWLGGSPVTYISSNPVWFAPADAAAAIAAQEPSPIDAATMTSAVVQKDSEPQINDISRLDKLAETPLRQTK